MSQRRLRRRSRAAERELARGQKVLERARARRAERLRKHPPKVVTPPKAVTRQKKTPKVTAKPSRLRFGRRSQDMSRLLPKDQ
jgi:hypothetical protein